MLDSVEPGSDQRRHRQVGVGVSTWNTILKPQGRRGVADDPQRAGAIVSTPRDRRRREAALDETLVTVDIRREEQREFAKPTQLTGQEVLKHRRESVAVG